MGSCHTQEMGRVLAGALRGLGATCRKQDSNGHVQQTGIGVNFAHKERRDHCHGHGHPSVRFSRQNIFSTVLLLFSLYAAAFLIRYAGILFRMGGSISMALGLFAALPMALSAALVPDLVDRISFELAIVHFNEAASIKVLEDSYRAVQDATDFRNQFITWFRDSQQARTMDDLREIYNQYCDEQSGEIELTGVCALLHELYGQVPQERKERVWRQLNQDLVGGVSFEEFSNFLVGRGKKHAAAEAYGTLLFEEVLPEQQGISSESDSSQSGSEPDQLTEEQMHTEAGGRGSMAAGARRRHGNESKRTPRTHD